MQLARIHAPGDIRLDDVDPPPPPGPRDVVVAVAQCGICGSDLSYATLGGIPGAASPFAFGHEFSGTVAEVGSEVSGLAVGDRVVVNPEGSNNAIGSSGLKGAFASAVLVEDVMDDPQTVLRLPDSLDFEVGALVEPLSVGMHGANQGGVAPGSRVVVMGAGPVGLGAGVAAKYKGADDVLVADLSEKRLAVAEELGLAPFKAGEGDLGAFLRDRHGEVRAGNPLLGPQPATDIFIEATGVGSVFEDLLRTARHGATVVVVGLHFAPTSLDMVNLLMRELHITAAIAYPTEFPEVLSMLESGEVDPRPMISHRFALSDFSEAFEQAQRADEAVKVLVDCRR